MKFTLIEKVNGESVLVEPGYNYNHIIAKIKSGYKIISVQDVYGNSHTINCAHIVDVYEKEPEKIEDIQIKDDKIDSEYLNELDQS